MKKQETSKKYIDYVCGLYGDLYDDRIEDSRPPTAGDKLRDPGENWMPGQAAAHKSLGAFQKELRHAGIELSSSKIRKILITGGCWSTERSREILDLFEHYTAPTSEGGRGLTSDQAMKIISDELQVSKQTVNMNLPYQNVVYKLENRSSNAVRCSRYKERKQKKKFQQQ